jgi:Na+/H+-dicarboxylate symporter
METITQASRNWYTRIPLVWRILIAFVLGIAVGITFYELESRSVLEVATVDKILGIIQPFGAVLVAMLKMVVFPIIFCSLVVGTASLPLKKFGKIGISVMLWYVFTSLCATVYGILVALLFNPKMDAASIDKLASGQGGAAAIMQESAAAGDGSFASFIIGIFQNPFEALATGNFIGVVVFAIVFGLAAKTVLDSQADDSPTAKHILNIMDLMNAVQRISFKLIDWVMEYFPFGVLAPIIKIQLNANRTTTNIRNSSNLSVTINASPFTIGFMTTMMILIINVLKMAILAILFCSFDKLFHSFIG